MELNHLTVAQVAAELGVSGQRVRQRIARGEMRAVRVNPRLLLVERAEMERWKAMGRLPAGRPRGTQKPASEKTTD